MEFAPDSTSFENDWIRYRKETWMSDDTIYAAFSAKILKTHLDSSRHALATKTIDFLKNDMKLVIPTSYTPPDDTVVAVASDRDDWFASMAKISLLVLLGVIIYVVFRLFRNAQKR